MKRMLDVVVALLAIVILSPVLIVAALACRFSLGSPVIFRHLRPGLHGKVFTMYKFRTMTDAREDGALLSDEARLTSLGQFLRRTSIDELPGLLNVLKGEMSLVGPRPLLTDYLPLYNPHESRRHEVRPGMTGLAQINGRNAATWKEKFEYDVWYVENRTFMLDLKILLITIGRVFAGDGITQPGHATAEPFKGEADRK